MIPLLSPVRGDEDFLPLATGPHGGCPGRPLSPSVPLDLSLPAPGARTAAGPTLSAECLPGAPHFLGAAVAAEGLAPESRPSIGIAAQVGAFEPALSPAGAVPGALGQESGLQLAAPQCLAQLA